MKAPAVLEFVGLMLAFVATVPAGCASVLAAHESAPRHHLDTFDAPEIAAVAHALTAAGELRDGVELVSLSLAERDKDGPVDRSAIAVLYERSTDRTREAVVDLAARRVISVDDVPGAAPMIGGEDFELAARILREDKDWIAALARRAIDPADVYIDVWAPGEIAGAPPGRHVRAIHFLKRSQTNEYGPPIEGLEALVDLTQRRVVELIDAPGPTPSRESTDFFDPVLRGAPRPGLKALRAEQPDGPSFAWKGGELCWQGWRMRWTFDAREGLVLRAIAIEDGAKLRSVLHRASVSELWVPYGSPDPRWAWRNAFDSGEYGLGRLSNRLVLGLDVPENAELLDAVSSDAHGALQIEEDVIAVFERDGGILWSHAGRETIGARSRELVWRSVVTVGNYDYGFEWVFRQDGSIGFRTDLTGIVLAQGVDAERCVACARAPGPDGTLVPDGPERHGTLIAPHILGVNHQHFVSLRLDFDVDGVRNSLRELDVEPDPGTGNAFVVRRREIGTETVAQRDVDFARQRCWEVYAPDSIGALGHPAAYRIAIHGSTPSFADPASPSRVLAAFVDHALWATRWKPRELFAAGDYPSQGGDGLAHFVANGESLAGEDLVVWATLGVTHAPRPEDWPVMPAAHAGLELAPLGFFARNPALHLAR